MGRFFQKHNVTGGSGALAGKRPDDKCICQAINDGIDTPAALFHHFYPDEPLYGGSPNYSHLCKRIRSLRKYNIIQPIPLGGRRFKYVVVKEDNV